MNNTEMKCFIAAFMCHFSSVCIWPFLDFNSSMQDIEVISFSFFSHYFLDDFRCQALYQNLYSLPHLHSPKLLRQVLHEENGTREGQILAQCHTASRFV